MSNSRLEHSEDRLKDKFTNNVNKISSERPFDSLKKISIAFCRQATPRTYYKSSYFITFLYVVSRYLEVKLFRNTDEAFETFAQFANAYENNASTKRIRHLAADNDTEYVNKRFRSLLDHKGVVHQLYSSYTKELNGIFERINRTLINKVTSISLKAKLPMGLWCKTYLAATYLNNHIPPFETELQDTLQNKIL